MTDTEKMAHPIVAPKKLIEVALPLDEINKASAREKSIRHGHPSTLHLWWARRPLAAARAVLFAQLVNDPSWKYSEEELKKPQIKSAITRKRNELFKLITQLVQWENINKEEVLSKARAAIRESWRETCEANKKHPAAKTLFDPDKLPPFHDPFAGGGSIPLEAQRLGLEAHATDLNPVAVLINKAMIEIPPKFAGRPPVGPIPPGEKQTKSKETEDWSGSRGLAEDVRRYGAWMREEAWKRVGSLYPKVKITKEIVKKQPDLGKYEGEELTVIAWLWARTVASPSPAFDGLHVPLISNYFLSTKSRRSVWLEPVVSGRTYHFRIRTGEPDDATKIATGTKDGTRANFKCIISGAPITPEYIRKEGTAGRMGATLIGVALEGKSERVYLTNIPEQEVIAASVKANWAPAGNVPERLTGGTCFGYGLTTWGSLFTSRQLNVLVTFSDIVGQIREKVRDDAKKKGWQDDGLPLEQGGTAASAYGDAIACYLGISVARYANASSTLCTWNPGEKKEDIRFTFSRQALPMTWDFAEGNPFSDSSGNFGDNINTWIFKAIAALPAYCRSEAHQADAATQPDVDRSRVISTDPPYYDNIGYADLSDFFYVWIRRSLSRIFPTLTGTILVPKKEELVAAAYRHGSREAAEEFFLAGMSRAVAHMASSASLTTPVTIYYAFKQADTDSDTGTASTGWETFLHAVIQAGFSLTGTWPMRTERGGRSVGNGTNALASSIVLVCRARVDAVAVSRKDFLRELDRALPMAIAEMTADATASIAPVDLAQAAIGPGMAIFSKYKAVLEADGSPMSVHSALIHINKAIDDYFAQAEGDMDADTRFCIGWFQQYQYEVGPFGQADVLARAKGTSVEGVRDAGVLHASKGEVRLLRVKEYPASWDPTKDSRLPIWEACHQMCRALGESESEAGALLARMPDKQDAIRQLAYRLYTICERKGWAEDARAYNELVTSWPAIVEQSLKAGHKGSQMSLL